MIRVVFRNVIVKLVMFCLYNLFYCCQFYHISLNLINGIYHFKIKNDLTMMRANVNSVCVGLYITV